MNHLSRRESLRLSACGFGSLALSGLLAEESRAADPLAPKKPHFPGKAKHVIFLFVHGGVSHVDTFDPKPELEKRHGQPLPGKVPVAFSGGLGALTKSPWKFKNYGKSGLPVSDLLPHIGSVIDDIAVVRSMTTQNVAHAGAVIELHTGSGQFIRPSVGSWVVYGLGTENANLPGFISFGPPDFQGGAQNYGAAFLPATYQGTAVGNHLTPIATSRINNLDRAEATDSLQRKQLDLIQRLNREHQTVEPTDTRLEARIQSYERTRLPHAGERTGGDGRVPRTGPGSRDVRDRRRGDRQLRSAVPHGTPAGRTGRPLRAVQPRLQVGPARRPRRRQHFERERSGPAYCGAGEGLEAAGAA